METKPGLYNVTFVGQYFNLVTVVDADNQEQAIRFAQDLIANEYGWDVEEVSQEITATLEGTWA